MSLVMGTNISGFLVNRKCGINLFYLMHASYKNKSKEKSLYWFITSNKIYHIHIVALLKAGHDDKIHAKLLSIFAFTCEIQNVH